MAMIEDKVQKTTGKLLPAVNNIVHYGLTAWLGALWVAKGFAVSKSATFVTLITLREYQDF